MNTQEIALGIIAGDFDDELFKIENAVKHRQAALNPIKVLSAKDFKVGDTVKFNKEIRPTRLIGQTGKVTKVNVKTVKVILDQPDHRFTGVVGCPISLIECVVE